LDRRLVACEREGSCGTQPEIGSGGGALTWSVVLVWSTVVGSLSWRTPVMWLGAVDWIGGLEAVVQTQGLGTVVRILDWATIVGGRVGANILGRVVRRHHPRWEKKVWH
jgi:hypothetical protein